SDAVERLTPIGWDRVARELLLPSWLELASLYRPLLAGVAPERLPATREDLRQFGVRANPELVAPGERAGLAERILGCALALALSTLDAVVLDFVRPVSAIHPLWMGTLGSGLLDASVAASFSLLVLAAGPISRRSARGHLVVGLVVRLGVGASVVFACALALVRHAMSASRGVVVPTAFVPPLALVGLVIVSVWTSRLGRPAPRVSTHRPWSRAAAVAVGLLALALLHIETMGATDYRRPADAIVVLGAKVNADGRPAASPFDRTRTAC